MANINPSGYLPNGVYIETAVRPVLSCDSENDKLFTTPPHLPSTQSAPLSTYPINSSCKERRPGSPGNLLLCFSALSLMSCALGLKIGMAPNGETRRHNPAAGMGVPVRYIDCH